MCEFWPSPIVAGREHTLLRMPSFRSSGGICVTAFKDNRLLLVFRYSSHAICRSHSEGLIDLKVGKNDRYDVFNTKY